MRHERPRRPERWVLWGLLTLGLLLRVATVWRFRVNSDEPQHLHVVWAWTQGLLPYRDVFDNHMPLFHVMSIPALLVVGERPTAVLWMRLVMLPLWGAVLLLTAVIGKTLFSSRVGYWAAVLGGLFPLFFFCSLEYRPDVLWTVLWLGAVAVAVGGPPTPRRGLALGLLLGTAVAVSLKTTLMVFAIVLATVGTLAFAPAGKRPWRAVLGAGAATAVGLFIVPGLVAWFFVAHDAVEPFLYGTVWHNLVPDLDAKVARSVRMTGLAVVPVALLGAHGVVNHAAATRLGLRRAFLVLVTAGYVALLWGAWPIVTRQDMLPVFPLVAILLTAVLIELPVSAGGLPSAILPAVAAVEILVLSLNPKVRVAEAQATSGLMADMLRLVPPGESVFDPKGDVVFRPRATYWVFESLTRARVRMGLIGDDFAKSLLRTRTCVVTGSHHLPPRTREWVQAHYLRVTRYPGAGSVLVAGARFDPISESFDVGIPTVYALVGATDVPRGLLDGRPYDGPRMLTTGRHTYRGSAGEGRIALLWAPAVEQAFSPFDAQGNWR